MRPNLLCFLLLGRITQCAPNGKIVTIEGMDAAAEMAAWDNMAPVGREFGSPDYERLAELDNLAFKAKGSLLKARRWLDAPQKRLGGLSPEEAAKSPEGFEQVKQLLVASKEAKTQ